MNVVEGKITIKTITGTSFTVDLCQSASVSSLKMLIEVSVGIPVEDQNLHFNGERLDNTHTLGHYGIESGDVVSLVPNLTASGDSSDGDGNSKEENWLKHSETEHKIIKTRSISKDTCDMNRITTNEHSKRNRERWRQRILKKVWITILLQLMEFNPR